MADDKDKTGKVATTSAVPTYSGKRFQPLAAKVGTRIGEIADARGGNSALAKICDLKESTVRNWRSGVSEPDLSDALGIARAGGVTLDWLATGEGPKHPTDFVSSADHVFIPLYDVEAAAGQGAFVNGEPTEQSLAFRRDWLARRIGVAEKHLALLSVRGDSMEPTLHDGDVIMVNRADVQISEGIFVFLLDGWLMVKRLQARADGVWMVSENPKYGESQLPDFKDFDEPSRIIGRVIWLGRRL